MTARSPRGPLTAAALSLLLFASACRDEPKIIVKKVEGASVVEGGTEGLIESAAEGASLSVPQDLPAFAPAYPGARLATRIGGDAVRDGRGALMVFETADPVEKIAAFYDAKAKEAGASAAVMVTEADSAVRIYGGKDKGNGAMVAISKSEDKPGSEIVITSGLPEADVVHIERKPEAWRETVRMPVRLQ